MYSDLSIHDSFEDSLIRRFAVTEDRPSAKDLLMLDVLGNILVIIGIYLDLNCDRNGLTRRYCTVNANPRTDLQSR